MKTLFFAVIVLITISACASIPMGLRHSTTVEGNSVTYVSSQAPGPTVVFESGLGDGLSSWAPVYSATSEFASVFAYSRPGYSNGLFPMLSAGVRTADDAARFLKRTLEKTGTPPPYILVGHSIGGLYMLEFARDYPESVAGLVLVDARLPEFTRRCLAAGVKPCSPPATAALMAPPHIRAELNGMAESERTGPEPIDMGSIPTILLAATQPPRGASLAGQTVWLEVQQDFADGLANGRLQIAEGAGHYIHEDVPEMVIAAIRELMPQGNAVYWRPTGDDPITTVKAPIFQGE